MQDYRDPGWGKARRALLPFGRGRSGEGSTLEAMRMIFAGLALGLVLFLLVLTFVAPYRGERDVVVPWGVIVLCWGVVSVVAGLRLRARPLELSSESEMVRSWQSQSILGVAIAESAALVAFAASFMVGGWNIYVLGLVFALAGLAIAGPSKANIARYQERIFRSGSSLSLGQALTRPVQGG